MQTHKGITCVILLSYIVFNGCFMFPFSNERIPFDYEKFFMIILGYGIIGICFAGVLDRHKSFLVLILTFCFTIIGMVFRYFLEYGEVSNMMNFIPINIISFVIIIPLYCTAVYWSIYKWNVK